MVVLQSAPLSLDALVSETRGDGDGAVTIFLGTVRDHNRGRRVIGLEYVAYGEMALREMRRIEQEALQRFDISGLALGHRTGNLEIGETSVAVVVASAHRGAAFDACRFVIDTLKSRVPIWKRERYEDGEAWIEGS